MGLSSKDLETIRKEMKQAFKDFDTDRSGYIERH